MNDENVDRVQKPFVGGFAEHALPQSATKAIRGASDSQDVIG